MAFIYGLEHEDGTPADPPTFRSSPGTSWKVGDLLSLGLSELELRASPDLEADVSGRGEGDGLTRLENGGCTAHAGGPDSEHLFRNAAQSRDIA